MLKILIVKTSALGDIVHLFQTIQFLKPYSSQIDWVVEKECASLVEAHPLVNQALLIETKKWRKHPFRFRKEIQAFIQKLQKTTYDVVFDFQGNTKSGLVTAFAKSPKKVGFGWKTAPEKPNLLFTNTRFDPPPGQNIRLDYLSLAEGYFGRKHSTLKSTLLTLNSEEQTALKGLCLKKDPARKNILVCPGSAWSNKRLLDPCLIEFLQGIDKNTQFFFTYGNLSEKEQAVKLASFLKCAEVIDKLPLPLLQHFMKEMSEVIAMDSLPLHLAAETGVATFSLFGPSLASKYRTLREGDVAFQGTCPYGQVFLKRCPLLRTCPTGACLHNLSAQNIIENYNKIY